MVGSRLAVDWVHHAIHAELQLCKLLAKGANMLADVVKCLSCLRAERAFHSKSASVAYIEGTVKYN